MSFVLFKIDSWTGFWLLSDAQSPKPDAPEVPKNDLPDKFWASVEPYCRPITAEDISYLQDLIRTREEERNSDLYTIPPLGKHYTQRWAEEDAGDMPKRPTQLGYGNWYTY